MQYETGVMNVDSLAVTSSNVAPAEYHYVDNNNVKVIWAPTIINKSHGLHISGFLSWYLNGLMFFGLGILLCY